MESIRHASISQLLGLLVSVAPLAMGIVFAFRPTEDRLTLMRPLSLAGIFAAVCSLLLGLANALQAVAITDAARTSAAEPTGLRFAALVLSEAVVPAFVAFACLTVAWLCVAVGMRKQS